MRLKIWLFDPDRLLHVHLSQGHLARNRRRKNGSTVARGDQDSSTAKNPSLDPSGVPAKFDLAELLGRMVQGDCRGI